MKKIRFVLVSVILIAVLVMSSCVTYTSFDELATIPRESTTAYYYETLPEATAQTEVSTAVQEITTQSAPIAVETTAQPELTTQAVVVETTAQPQPSEPAVTEPDYTQYSVSQIIDAYAQALNKTRNYTGRITVNHTESFDASIKEAQPGGALTQLLADNIVKLVGSEGQQTLNFNEGYAVNADGETVPVLLPQRTAFALDAQGVSSAEISKNGDKTHIKLVLIPETVSMGQVPHYNSTAIGYLDTSGMDFKIITISRVDITYPGSVIDAVINSDGFVESVTYTINMSTYAELSGMGISGYGTLEGAQTEKWQMAY